MNKKIQTNLRKKITEVFFKTKRRMILTAIAGVVVLFLIWKTVSGSGTKVQYQTATVTKGTIISSVSETGNIATGSQGGVGSPTKGIVTDIYVKNGDQVKQGQNLFKVKSTATTQEIASAYSSYQSAIATTDTAAQNKLTAQATLEKDRAAVINAQINVNTMTANVGGSKANPATGSPYTQNDIDTINSALTSSRETFSADELKYEEEDQTIAADNAALNSAQLAYQATQDSIVTAPIGGTVENISVRQGDEIAASAGNLSSELNSSTNSTSSPVLFIANSSNPYIKVQASEVDIPHIKEGQKATITLNAFNGQTFAGKVDQVDSVGTNTSGVITYNVFVSFIAPPQMIRPGMSATVNIQTDRKDNVITVPIAAVQTSSATSTVRVLKDGQVNDVDVTAGISSDTDTEIISGLSEGDLVVIGVTSTGSGSSATSPFSSTLRFGGGGGALFRGGGGGAARGGAGRGQ